MRVPKYRKHSSRDWAFVEVGGERVRLPGRYNSAESRAAYAEVLRGLASQEQAPARVVPVWSYTVARLVEGFLDWAVAYYGANKEYGQLRYACQVLLAVAGDVPVAQFSPLLLEAVQNAMVTGGWVGPGQAPRPWQRGHINHQINRLRRVFRWGVRKDLVPGSVLERLRAVPPLKKGRTAAVESAPVIPIPDSEFWAVWPYLPNPVVRAMAAIQWWSGMRPGNVCRLRTGDLDRSGPVWLYIPPEHKKSYEDRRLVIPLGPRAQAAAFPFWMSRPADAWWFSPREGEALRLAARRRDRRSPMTPSQSQRTRLAQGRRMRPLGEVYTPDGYWQAIQYAVARLNRDRARAGLAPVPAWCPLRVRHSVATRVRRAFNVEAAQVVLGHASAEVTQVYAERDLDLARQVAAEIG